VAEPPHRTRFALEYDDERVAETVAVSLANEVGEIDDDRSRTSLSRDGRTVRIDIGATDLVALRAASNTWLSLAAVAERTAETVE
jgi:KEOPS complex subunit Pcc1